MTTNSAKKFSRDEIDSGNAAKGKKSHAGRMERIAQAVDPDGTMDPITKAEQVALTRTAYFQAVSAGVKPETDLRAFYLEIVVGEQ